MYLGDNLIGSGIQEFCTTFENSQADALILLKQVEDPSTFGVVEIDGDGRVVSLVEKPKQPRYDLALVGIYFFSLHFRTWTVWKTTLLGREQRILRTKRAAMPIGSW